MLQGRYVLARIFGGTEGLFAREEEQRIFAGVAKAGLGPKLLVRIQHLIAQIRSCMALHPLPGGHGSIERWVVDTLQ